MAVIEQSSLMKRTDTDGNMYLMYPITTKDNVDGMEEIDAHLENNDVHVTSDEKTGWNSKAEGSHAHIVEDVNGLQNELDGKASSDHTHDSSYGITTSGTGEVYTATVGGITELASGIEFIMIPHTESTVTNPKLNVNSLGEKYIRRPISGSMSLTTTGNDSDWLASGKPVRMIYNGTFWIVDDRKPNVNDLYGTVSIEKGGTGATTAEDARVNLGIQTTGGTTTSQNADYAEVGEWADGNSDDEDRIGYFVAVDTSSSGTTMVKATSTADVRGVTVTAPAFAGNCSDSKFDESGNLLQQYDYVAVMGLVSIIDNGTCTVNGRCMPDDNGTAAPSTNDMGYQVIDRVDDTHVLIAVEPGADMIQRMQAVTNAMRESLDNTVRTVNGQAPDEEGNVIIETASEGTVSSSDDGNGNVVLELSGGSGQTGSLSYRLKGKTVVFFGDSICAGTTSSGGYAELIGSMTGCIVINKGVSGATIANAGTSTTKIVDVVKQYEGESDYFCIEGFANDYNQGIPLGTATSGYNDTLDETTFSGALESICQTLLSHETAKVVAVMTHNCTMPTTQNADTGLTLRSYHDTAIEIYQKYGIKVYDAFLESGLNTGYSSSTNLPSFAKRLADTYTVDGDKVHPNQQGYEKYYVRQIIDVLSDGDIYDIVNSSESPSTPVTYECDFSITGFVRNNGTISTAAGSGTYGHKRTDYIPMDGVTSISLNVGGYSAAYYISFFDSSKTCITSLSRTISDNYGDVSETIEIDSSYSEAAYFVISHYNMAGYTGDFEPTASYVAEG